MLYNNKQFLIKFLYQRWLLRNSWFGEPVLYFSKFQQLTPLAPSFKQSCSVLYCHDPAGETQCCKRWMQIATYVPTSENKSPPLWNMKKKRNFAFISLGVKVKAPSVIPVSYDMKPPCSYILLKNRVIFSVPPTWSLPFTNCTVM